MIKTVIIVGSGNAALSAGIAALEKGANVTIYEKADKKMAGGNTKYTAGAMRFAYENSNQLIDLLKNPNDERLKNTDFGSYTEQKFEKDRPSDFILELRHIDKCIRGDFHIENSPISINHGVEVMKIIKTAHISNDSDSTVSIKSISDLI